MGKVKKRKPFIDLYASLKDPDNYGTLFVSMLQSTAYQSLSLGAKQFYTYCRVQSRSKEGTACLYMHGIEDGIQYPEHCFVFPSSHLMKYGVDRSNAAKYFRELEQKGFLVKYERNQHRRKVNVYAFSDHWKKP